MSTVALSPFPILRFTDNNGNSLVGGTLTTFQAGTNTPLATYVDSTGTTPNTNPIVLNGRGEVAISTGASCGLWIPPNIAYKFVLADALGNQIWTIDNLTDVITFLTGATVGPVMNPQSVAEITLGITPTDYIYPVGDSRRYGLDTTGTIDVTVGLQQLLDVAGIAALDGEVRTVTVQAGTYKVTRLYMHYSNVSLCLTPGCTIKQTQTGIVNNNTTGQAPAYAVIHVNPLSYVNNPSASVTPISNVCIYGSGIVQGPYASTHAYDGFAMGIVSNDCNSCWVEDVTLFGCGGENILLNPSAWNTCTDLRLQGNDISQGGEVGINNARDFIITDNYVHDSWVQNGLGGNGDGGFVCYNRIRSMYGAGMTFGGSGARDINECRNVIYGFNSIENTNVGSGSGYAIFGTDDGATTTPKTALKLISNVINLNQSGTGAIIGFDFAIGYVDVEHNIIIGGNSAVSTAGIAVIAGDATYNLRDNDFAVGAGNMAVCMDILGGTPTVNLYSYNNLNVPTSVGHPTLFALIDCEFVSTVALTLSGVSGTPPTVNVTFTRRGNTVTALTKGTFLGPGSGTTCGATGIPSGFIPMNAATFVAPVENNGTIGSGLVQVLNDGTLSFSATVAGGAFSSTGNRGLPDAIAFTYALN